MYSVVIGLRGVGEVSIEPRRSGVCDLFEPCRGIVSNMKSLNHAGVNKVSNITTDKI